MKVALKCLKFETPEKSEIRQFLREVLTSRIYSDSDENCYKLCSENLNPIPTVKAESQALRARWVQCK
ncbi:35482_t:CDS:2 [Gigaspora margarita]|uniref:35482_t:CDS:1 n=1 Tax=Gigaspora margarita TaxID=4874 RepID=A0ABM8VVX2_GIGMA|nr:35482_t:CDS:2 [Gigaspora margarita]